jgi:hypothetical protein
MQVFMAEVTAMDKPGFKMFIHHQAATIRSGIMQLLAAL